MTAAPLSNREFAASLAAIGGIEPHPLLAVAVSGGPDSLALALLADTWARQRGGRICGVIVDHRLRADSADEARRVAAWLAARGIRCEILTWDGAKPETGIQEAARAARYRLLARWCRAAGCLHLLTAHHRDDQVETYRLRRAAGSGPDGLAAMSAVRALAGCRLLRPLLGVSKARLIALLQAAGQPYVIDPSNVSPIFARGRLRLAAANGPAVSGDAEPEDAALAAHGRARVAREHAAATLLAAAVTLHPAGFASIAPTGLAGQGDALVEYVLGRIAATVAGAAAYPPRRRRLAALRERLAAGEGAAATFGGCRWLRWRGRILVARELAAAAAPATLAPGAAAHWDRRFAVTVPAAAPAPLRLAYLGVAGVAELRRSRRQCGGTAIPPLVHPSLAGFWDETGLAAVPHLGFVRDGTALPSLVFRPCQALAQLSFTVV